MVLYHPNGWFPGKWKTVPLFPDLRRKNSMELIDIMQDKKICRDPDLTMKKLSDQMEIPQYLLSEVINEELGSGFNEFIKLYRVEEVKQLLKDPDYDHLTIEAISKVFGFNSRSSFYSAFRKITGGTPSSSRSQIRAFIYILIIIFICFIRFEWSSPDSLLLT